MFIWWLFFYRDVMHKKIPLLTLEQQFGACLSCEWFRVSQRWWRFCPCPFVQGLHLGTFCSCFYLLLLWSFFLIQNVSSVNFSILKMSTRNRKITMYPCCRPVQLYFWVGRLFPRSEPDDDKVEPEGRDGQVHVLYLSWRLIWHCCHLSAYGVSFFNFYNILLYTYIFNVSS